MEPLRLKGVALGMRIAAELILSLSYLLFSGMILGVILGLMVPIIKYGLRLLMALLL